MQRRALGLGRHGVLRWMTKSAQDPTPQPRRAFSKRKDALHARCCPAAVHMPRQPRLCTELARRSLIHATGGSPAQGRRSRGLFIVSATALTAMRPYIPGAERLFTFVKAAALAMPRAKRPNAGPRVPMSYHTKTTKTVTCSRRARVPHQHASAKHTSGWHPVLSGAFGNPCYR